ncbi:hypothetical protein HZB74_03500, partial [Candidatus Saccharibacteria bacterium]|nr:hypothetical protein [Candidatus Saccharibacteria bacterium]
MDKEPSSDSLDSLDSSTDNLEMASPTSPTADFVSTNAHAAYLEVKEKKQPLEGIPGSQEKKRRLVKLSGRSVVLVSAIITIVVLFLTGVSALFLSKNQKDDSTGAKLVPSQNVDINTLNQAIQADVFSGKERALLVNGDIIANGSLSVTSDGFVAVLKPASLSSNQEYILPDSSGTICLSSNNCDFATLEQLNILQSQLGQIVIPSTPDIPASSLVNNQVGSVNIQGTNNRISISTANGVITVSTPQDIATISSPTFANLVLTGNFNLGGVLDLPLNCSINANGGSLTTNASGQVICSDDDNAGGTATVGSPGGTVGTIPVFTAAQTIADSIISQALGTITVAGDLSVSGDVTLSSLSNGFLSVDGAGLVSVNTIDLGSDTSGNYVLSVSAGNGLSIGGVAGEGWTPSVSLSLQANKGLEVDGNGLSLIDCSIGEILKYNGSAQWICATDSGASGLGDDIYVNGNPLDNANFLDSSASATNASVSLSVNPVDPDEITISIGAASATDAGIVTANAQAFGGTKTFNGQIVAISGIDNNNAGITNMGSIAGATTYNGSGLLTNTGGATISGGTVNLNATGANITNIANGVATGSTSIGNATGTLTLTGSSASTIVLNGVTVDATEFNRLAGKDAALVDTNDAVATAITGTGALNSGSITSGFGSIDTGADNITTTGTVTAGTLNVNSENFTDLTGNGLQNSANVLTLLIQANKGLEVDGNGLSLIDCANGELLKYNGSNQWACASDID